jgi:hypothetical protein
VWTRKFIVLDCILEIRFVFAISIVLDLRNGKNKFLVSEDFDLARRAKIWIALVANRGIEN